MGDVAFPLSRCSGTDNASAPLETGDVTKLAIAAGGGVTVHNSLPQYHHQSVTEPQKKV